MRPLLLPLLLIMMLFPARPSFAMDQIGGFPDIFNPALARAPRPGEWLEFRVAFPVDPLENSLRGDPAPVPRTGPPQSALESMGEGEEYFFFKPTFEPEQAWRILPLRIEIREVDAEGCNAVLSFEVGVHEIRIPAASDAPGAEFRYDEPPVEDHRIRVRMDGNEYEVDVVRRMTDSYGFVRWFSPDVPFGIFRFATPDIDLILVGVGMGRPPEFPLTPKDDILPPPGLLYENPEE